MSWIFPLDTEECSDSSGQSFPKPASAARKSIPLAMGFCIRKFSIEPVRAVQDFSLLSAKGSFDLIWCGSLVTHITENSAIALLRFFRDHLTEHGVCVFSTHGDTSADWLRQGKHTYGLTPREQEELLRQFEQSGYGYVDYSNVLGYGISLASPKRMEKIISQLGTCVFQRAAVWDHHHDIYGFQR